MNACGLIGLRKAFGEHNLIETNKRECKVELLPEFGIPEVLSRALGYSEAKKPGKPFYRFPFFSFQITSRNHLIAMMNAAVRAVSTV